MVLEVMDAKKIEKAFILGTSQGQFQLLPFPPKCLCLNKLLELNVIHT